jgi:hypothetical protein
MRKAPPAAKAAPSMRNQAGARRSPVAPIRVVARTGAVPPAIPIPTLKETD